MPLLDDEVADQEGDVLAPLTQRRQVDVHDLQAVEQVLAEGAGAHARGEVGIARGDEPEVAADWAPATEAPKLPFLKHAEELTLRGEGNVGDLVEKEGGAMGQLEDSHPLVIGPRERAPLVAEQLTLEERWRDGVAVEGDELLRGARAELVDQAGDQLLAGTRLPRDQDGYVRGGDALDQPPDPKQRRASAVQDAAVIDRDLYGLLRC